MKSMKKTIAALVAVSMIFGCVIGGTIAWLTATSGQVVNTFTTSDINVILTETDADSDGNANNNSYKMVPGHTITKDPKAKVVAGSEDCFLFVKIDKSANYDTYLEEYQIAAGWTELEEDVYYMVFDSKSQADNKPTMGTDYPILLNNQVVVQDSVTKKLMEDLNKSGATKPTLTFTVYAHQLYQTNTPENGNNGQFTAEQAWENLNA